MHTETPLVVYNTMASTMGDNAYLIMHCNNSWREQCGCRMQSGRKEQCTLEKSVPAATAAVSSVQRSFIPFNRSSRQRTVCAASSLEGARMTAPGPFTASELLSELPFAVISVPTAVLTFLSAASADDTWPCRHLLPDGVARTFCSVLDKAGLP